jgi:Ca-activated chloride channel family protein
MKLVTRLTQEKVRFDQETDAHLVLTLTAPAVNAEKTRPKLALIMCIDTSSSMAGPKLEYAKQSVLKMIEHMKGDDVFGVVTFDSQVRVVAAPQRLEGHKDEFRKAVQGLTTSGMTNFSGGMLKSIDLLKNLDLNGSYIHRVIMFTDGQANVGPAKEPAEIIKLLKANAEHVTASAFGYGSGTDFSPDFLTEFAKEGKGNYAHVEDPDKALQAFGTELGGLISTYATDVRIELKPLNGHSVEKVISDVDVDEENTGEVYINVPDLLAEETRHLVVAVKMAKQKAHGPRAVNVFDVKATFQTFDAQGKKETHTVESKGRVQFVKEGDEDKKLDATLDDIVGLAQLVRSQLEAESQAKRGDYAAAAAVMEHRANDFKRRGREKLAAASSNIGGKMASASLYVQNNGYLKSFERGVTRGVGVASYSAGADYDLQELGVMTSTSSQTTTSASFTGSGSVVQPSLTGAVVAPAVQPVTWIADSSINLQGNPAWVGGSSPFSGDLGGVTASPAIPAVVGVTAPPTPPAPVPAHETSKSDAKSQDKASSKKSLKQTRSNKSW